MKRLLLLIIISVLFADCNKITEEWFITKLTGQAIPNGTIIFIKSKKGLDHPQWEYFTETLCDADGSFTYSFHADKEFCYGAYAKNENLCAVSETLFFGNGQKYDWVYNICFKNHFKFHIKNVNPHDNNDELWLNNTNETFTGLNVDTVVNADPWFQNHGNESYTFHWLVKKNYSQTLYSQKVFIKPCSTDSLHIDY